MTKFNFWKGIQTIHRNMHWYQYFSDYIQRVAVPLPRQPIMQMRFKILKRMLSYVSPRHGHERIYGIDETCCRTAQLRLIIVPVITQIIKSSSQASRAKPHVIPSVFFFFFFFCFFFSNLLTLLRKGEKQ